MDNPLAGGSRIGHEVEPVTLVIFGATGDLNKRKLMPALFSLAHDDRLPSNLRIVGFSRTPWSHEEFRQHMHDAVKEFGRVEITEESLWDTFAANLYYVPGNFKEPDSFATLDQFIAENTGQTGMPDNRLYYLAAPPHFFDDIIENLGRTSMAAEGAHWRRLIVEKPFGSDLDSAMELNRTLHAVFAEKQVYRIDHYLGKETVQNLLVLRFANTIFEPIWNRQYVDHVQISVAESVGVGTRADFYDQAGVIRDIFQNHILQVLTLVAMEPPIAFEAGAIRDEKVKVLRAMDGITDDNVESRTVRARYASGVMDGERVPGYLDEPNVPASSTTATFAALDWRIDNWRWQGVPFYVRSGKRLAKRVTEVSIHFKQPPFLLFGGAADASQENVLVIRIQPDEGISLRFEVKVPGQGVQRRSVRMDFRYGASFGTASLPDAYERLLLDAMLGDATLFARSDEIEHAWRLIDPLLNAWQETEKPPLELYEAGTWGPPGADRLLNATGRKWRRL